MHTIINIARAIDDNYKIPEVNNSDPAAHDWGTIVSYILSIIDLLLRFAGILCFVLVLYAAILYTVAYGDEAKAETAKKTMTWAIIGLVVVAISALIVNAIARELNVDMFRLLQG